MKKFIKFLVILTLITISIGLLVIGNGYNMYKNAIEENPLQEKVEEIRSKENCKTSRIATNIFRCSNFSRRS